MIYLEKQHLLQANVRQHVHQHVFQLFLVTLKMNSCIVPLTYCTEIRSDIFQGKAFIYSPTTFRLWSHRLSQAFYKPSTCLPAYLSPQIVANRRQMAQSALSNGPWGPKSSTASQDPAEVKNERAQTHVSRLWTRLALPPLTRFRPPQA